MPGPRPVFQRPGLNIFGLRPTPPHLLDARGPRASRQATEAGRQTHFNFNTRSRDASDEIVGQLDSFGKAIARAFLMKMQKLMDRHSRRDLANWWSNAVDTAGSFFVCSLGHRRWCCGRGRGDAALRPMQWTAKVGGSCHRHLKHRWQTNFGPRIARGPVAVIGVAATFSLPSPHLCRPLLLVGRSRRPQLS